MVTIKNWQEYSYYLALHLKNGEQVSFRAQFLTLHPNNQLAFIYMLNEHSREKLYRFITPTEFAEIFGRMEASEQQLVLEELEENYAKETVQALPTDEMVDFLSEFSISNRQTYLHKLDQSKRDKVKHMLGYGASTAGAIMTTEFITATPEQTTVEVLRHVRQQGEHAETIYYIYIVEQEQLCGVVSLKDILLESDAATMASIMQDKMITVESDTDQETVLHIVRDYDLLALPVVEQGKLVGIVTVDDVMDVYYEETEEDFGEMASVSGAIDLEVGTKKATQVRLTWLLRMLVTSVIPFSLIYFYQQQLLILALFIPIIASIAGNVGTQALAASLRVKEQEGKAGFAKLLKRDSSSAIIIGCVSATIVAILSYVVQNDNKLALQIFSVTYGAVMLSSVIGTLMPYVFKDSAYVSSPAVTTYSDVITTALLIMVLSF